MIDMVRRHEIQVLRREGRSLVEIAQQVGVSQSSVQRVVAEAPVASVDTAAARKERGIGRPSKAEPYRAFLAAELVADPELLSVELLRRAKRKGYTGGKSALYGLIKELRPARVAPIVRFEGVAGEFSQHDFGQVDVEYLDGRVERVHFFASRLKYSRWVQVSLVDNEQVESLVRALVEHYAVWGGVPLVSVFDRPKTIAIAWSKDGSVEKWNTTFAEVALELGVSVELCWPRSPRQKGAVENLVGWVKGSFFKQRRFADREDLESELAAWHVEVNTQRASRATRTIPAVRLSDEQARMRPLKVLPQNLALRVPLAVGPTGYVVHETHAYSMPPEASGLACTLWLYRDRVKIVAGNHTATHERLFQQDAISTLSEHRTKRVAAARGKRARLYTRRQHLLELGKESVEYITEVVHRRPKVWQRDVDELHELLDVYGERALRAAFAHCLSMRVFGHEYIAHHLTNPIAAIGVQQDLFS